ncbi:hypothetical protein BH09VER1_BH09VER1_51240 [soil metagenome]
MPHPFRSAALALLLILAVLPAALAHKHKDKYLPDIPPGHGGLDGATVIIIRHAEKPETGPGLAPEGQQRATAYVDYFKKFKVDHTPVQLTNLYAAGDSKESVRPRLTLEPLAKALRLPLDTSCRDKDFGTLAALLQSGPPHRVILICWHHGTIPDLVYALGGDPNIFPTGKWPGRSYGGMVVMRYDAQGKLIKARFLNEHLMPGDSP